MNIISIEPIESFIVETDSETWPTYRRNAAASWENLMGASWEECYSDEEELEAMFQAYLAKKRV